MRRVRKETTVATKAGIRKAGTLRKATATISVALLLFCSCREVNRTVYSEFVSFDRSGWDMAITPYFEPWPGDSTAALTDRYDVAIVARHSRECRLSQLPVVVEMENADGPISLDTLMIDFSNRESEIFGITESKTVIKTGYRLTPGFNILISPLLNQPETVGILNIGVTLEKSGIPKKDYFIF